ncbi:MAG TPA: glycerol-3-phosphate dehydrogenase/oxidase [Symbiobacteriaceae bacterium]|jgi:glycerol-3-phosphate dehydrogenase
MTVHLFSPAGRQAALAGMSGGDLDLLIVGGGITGCGLARDAALRGLKVALVEKEDFAYGTSSRSSKLIHGGLRYLAHGDFAVVRESGHERKALRTIAPHLVHPIDFVVPLKKGERLIMKIGLLLYDRLVGVSGGEAHRSLSVAETHRRVPHLAAAYTSGLTYGEYVTDDARFTMENALSAALHGAWVANHAAVLEFPHACGKVVGARVRDTLTGAGYDVRARVVVNATGPWAEETMRTTGFTPRKHLIPSKGVHLLFRAARLPITGAVGLKSPGGKMGFAIRRWDFVYAGTTDEPHQGPLDQPLADRAAVFSVLKMVQDSFPELALTEADIVGTWAGLRPLIAEPGKSTRDTSRHDEVWAGPDGMLTVAGGKLTTYRRMAARIMTFVARALQRDLGDNRRTAEVPLPLACASPDAAAVAALRDHGVSRQAIERITWLYGAELPDLLQLGAEDPAWLEPLAPGVPALRGEVRLAVEQEMALTLLDFMDRRSALLLFSADHGLGAAPAACRIMGGLLGWSEAEQAAQLELYRRVTKNHGFPEA